MQCRNRAIEGMDNTRTTQCKEKIKINGKCKEGKMKEIDTANTKGINNGKNAHFLELTRQNMQMQGINNAMDK